MEDAIELVSGPAPDTAVIFLHGLGIDGNNMVPLVKQLPVSLRRTIRFILPHAPFRRVALDRGRIARAWYDAPSFSIDAVPDIGHFRECEMMITALIHKEILRGITPSRIILAGFSQGGAVALHTGLRQRIALGGIAVLSGYLAFPHLLIQESVFESRAVPILMAHGKQDSLVSYAMARNSCSHLQMLGYLAEWRDYPMQHSVCQEEIADLAKWLGKIAIKEVPAMQGNLIGRDNGAGAPASVSF
jgi:phospholipase/carboxylesterase